MPPDEIAFRPSRAKQTFLLAIMVIVFLFSAAGLVLLWPLDPTRLENIAARTVLHNLRGLMLVVLAAFAAFGAAAAPMLAVMLLLNTPAFTMNADGIWLRGKTLIRWEEIDEIHEHVDHSATAPLQLMLVGFYLRDEAATVPRLGRAIAWQARLNHQQRLPPIVLATGHLQESVEEIMDTIEAYLDELREDDGKRKWPKVYRRRG